MSTHAHQSPAPPNAGPDTDKWLPSVSLYLMTFDAVSTAFGFLLGAFTGAAGTYYGYLFTDRRRAQEAKKAERDLFREIEQQMPDLITEFRESLKLHPLIREFFVLSSRQVCIRSNIPRFVYYEDEHADLRSKVAILESHGYVVDVTPKDTPVYRMTEAFVNLLRGRK